ELKPSGELNLTLTEERAVRTGNSSESGVEVQRATRNVVKRRVDVGPLCPVENVKAFSQQFEPRAFRNIETSRESCVDVPDIRLLEEVARYQSKPIGAARTINTSAWSLVAREPERLRVDRAADVSGIPLTGERIQDRRKRPAIENVLGRSVLERVRTVNNTRHKLLSAIEVRQAVFVRLVKGIERQVVRCKCGRALTVVRGTR